jgi:hypothetical protein
MWHKIIYPVGHIGLRQLIKIGVCTGALLPLITNISISPQKFALFSINF